MQTQAGTCEETCGRMNEDSTKVILICEVNYNMSLKTALTRAASDCCHCVNVFKGIVTLPILINQSIKTITHRDGEVAPVELECPPVDAVEPVGLASITIIVNWASYSLIIIITSSSSGDEPACNSLILKVNPRDQHLSGKPGQWSTRPPSWPQLLQLFPRPTTPSRA